MKWENEVYVKVYVRDTPEFLAMSWLARALLWELLRKVDRHGVLKVGRFGLPALAVAIRAPVAEIEGPVLELIEHGRLVWNEAGGEYVVPNFVAAQNTRQSAMARKRRERDGGARDHASHAIAPCDSMSRSDQIRF